MRGLLTRRQALGTAIGGAAMMTMGGRGLAASKTLNVLCHRVHQNSLTTGSGGDLTAAWRQKNDADVTYATFDTDPLQDRIFREASLDKTDFGVVGLVNSRATPNAAKLLEGLGPYQAKDPIEDYSDIAAGLVQAMTIGGKLIAIPFRTATIGLFYNEALMEERGIKAPPETLEELVDQSKKLTFTSAAGTPVTGMVMASDLSTFPVSFIRAYGGDFIGADMKLVPNPEAMEKALATMADMYKSGALPRTYATTSNDDQVTWLQQGRAVFTVLPFARYPQLNRTDQSKYPGKIKAIPFPGSESIKGKVPMASCVEFWALGIPANARDKELAWSFIREMSSKASTLGEAKNGNGPVRVSTFSDPGLIASNPWSPIEAKALAGARVPLPAFPEAARAQTMFLEEVQLAVLGKKTPKEAVAAVIERVKPLMPAA